MRIDSTTLQGQSGTLACLCAACVQADSGGGCGGVSSTGRNAQARIGFSKEPDWHLKDRTRGTPKIRAIRFH
jgi:hypothetical protein